MTDSRFSSERINELIGCIGRVARGDRSVQVDISGENDELDALAMAVNMMIDDLAWSEKEREKAQLGLQRSEERFRTVLKNIPGVIFSIDRDGKTLLSEGRALSKVDLSPGQTVGTSAFERYKEHPTLVPSMRRALDGELVNNTIHIGDLILDAYYSPLQDGEGNIIGMLGMGLDVTDKHQVESEREELQKQLLQAQKMEAVGRLAGGIAHDFNNLLTGIIGNVFLVLEDCGDDETETKEFLGEVNVGAHRAAALVRQLLAFSRKQVVERKLLNLSEMIQDMEKMLCRVIGEDIKLETHCSDKIGAVRMDPSQVEQIVMNLAVNARDAMPNGGHLILETSSKKLDEEFCSRDADIAPGDYVMLTISDSGTGMNEETRQNIFEPFFTTKPQGEGTGLGLSTVYGIVKQNRGAIHVYSEPGLGTTFKVFLPLSHEIRAPEQRRSEVPIQPGTETVLVVEDEDFVRNLASRVLTRAGYDVIQAENGREAVALVEELQDNLDLVLTDVVMPEMHGGEMATELRDKHPDLKILFMSGYTDSLIAQRGVLEPETSFIGKPFTPRALASKVRAVIDG
jgi:signal transduction histidine kinase